MFVDALVDGSVECKVLLFFFTVEMYKNVCWRLNFCRLLSC